MATNLIEAIQHSLEYPALKKIDPNSQDIKKSDAESPIELLAQAAIPAVLTGLYKLSRNDEGCLKIINSPEDNDSLFLLFGDKEMQLIENVAHYTDVSTNQAESHLENIADESVRLAKEITGINVAPQKLKQFMNDQRHHILVYLPAALNLGDLLKDEQLDDRTNKMEGPVSNFMHKIENKFSQGGS